jgi:hypothetical protein
LEKISMIGDGTWRFSKRIFARISFTWTGKRGCSMTITFLDFGSVSRELAARCQGKKEAKGTHLLVEDSSKVGLQLGR